MQPQGSLNVGETGKPVGQSDAVRERLSPPLLALKTEERAVSRGCWPVCSLADGKERGWNLPWSLWKEQPCWHIGFHPLRPLLDF